MTRPDPELRSFIDVPAERLQSAKLFTAPG